MRSTLLWDVDLARTDMRQEAPSGAHRDRETRINITRLRESSGDRAPRAGPHLARRLVGHAVRLPRVRRRRCAEGRLEARRRGNAGLRENGGCRRRRAGRCCSGHRRANRDQERRICACCGPRPCFRQALDEHWRNSSHTRPRDDDVQKRRPRGLSTLHIFTQFHLLTDGRREWRDGLAGQVVL